MGLGQLPTLGALSPTLSPATALSPAANLPSAVFTPVVEQPTIMTAPAPAPAPAAMMPGAATTAPAQAPSVPVPACAPTGFTWDTSSGGFWRQLRQGEAPFPATTCVSTTRAHGINPAPPCSLPGFTWDTTNGGFWRRLHIGERPNPIDVCGQPRTSTTVLPPTLVSPTTAAPVAVGPAPVAALPAPTAPTVPAPLKYQGCLSRYNTTHGTYSIYCPVGWVAPAGATTGFFGAFGATETVTPAPPAGMVKVADEPVQPPGTVDAGPEAVKTPFYKSVWFWAAVGGVIVVGGGSYLLIRRRRHHQPAA